MAVAAMVALAALAAGCAAPLQPKPIEMTPIGTVPDVVRTPEEPDGGTTTSPNGSAPSTAKEAACTMAEIESLDQALRLCDSPMPRAGEVVFGLSDKLEMSVASSAPSTKPGGRIDVTLTLTNRTAESLPLYFTGEPTPRFEVEGFDAKGTRRVDLPTGKAPKTAYPPVRPVKAWRIILMPGGSARIRAPWEAMKTRYAPEKVRTWEGRGAARTALASLPYGKYQLRVAVPLILAEKGELDTPKVAIDVVAVP